MRHVFDDKQTVGRGEIRDTTVPGRTPVKMHRHDGTRTRCHQHAQQRSIDIMGRCVASTRDRTQTGEYLPPTPMRNRYWRAQLPHRPATGVPAQSMAKRWSQRVGPLATPTAWRVPTSRKARAQTPRLQCRRCIGRYLSRARRHRFRATA